MAGVDGSASSRDALRWAARQAELTGARVKAVMAWAVAPAAFPLTTPVPATYDMGPEAGSNLKGLSAKFAASSPGTEISSVVERAGQAENC